MLNLEHITIIGAGMMGHGIAQIFASHGHQVSLVDVSDEILVKAVENIRANLMLLAKNGIDNEKDIESIIKRVRVTRDLEEAVSKAQFVIEAVSENLDLKQRLFQRMDAICSSDAVLATNTSVISIGEIAAKAARKDRIVGTHFWSPPYLIPLVEVIKGEETSSKVVDVTVDLLRSVGKHPVKVKKDVPGFVGNRLQHALWREAISLVEKGIADPEDIDRVVKYGFGLRLPFLGPLETADLAGLDLVLDIHQYLFSDLENRTTPSPLLKKLVNQKTIGVKTRKGFYPWTDESIKQIIQQRDQVLLKISEVVKKLDRKDNR